MVEVSKMKVDKEKFESLKSEMSDLYKLIILANYDLMNLTPSLGGGCLK